MERREAPGRCATAPLWCPAFPPNTDAPCLNGLARPIRTGVRDPSRGTRGRVIWRLARPRHRTAAPPGAPPRRQVYVACGRITNRVVGGPLLSRCEVPLEAHRNQLADIT